MAQVRFTNNGKTTLNGAINNSVTTIVVTDGTVLPALSGGDWFYLTLEDNVLAREIVKVTARSTHTLTVVRGQDGTAAASWASGVKAENRITKAAIDELAAAVSGITPGSAFLALVDDTTNGALLTTLGINANVQTWLATPSSANLLAAMSDKTGTGLLVFGTSPTLTTPALGTPSALVLTNATGLPLASVTGFASGIAAWLATPSSANLRAAMTDESGSGALLFAGGALGTPASGVLTNCTGLPNASVVGLGTAALVADNTLVHLAGTETITGAKTFSIAPRLENNISLAGRETGGTGRALVRMNASNVMEFGDANNNATFLNATNTFNGDMGVTGALSVTGALYQGGSVVMTRGATETVTGAKTFTGGVTINGDPVYTRGGSNRWSAGPGAGTGTNDWGLYNYGLATLAMKVPYSSSSILFTVTFVEIGSSGVGTRFYNSASDYQAVYDKDNTGAYVQLNTGSRGYRWLNSNGALMSLSSAGAMAVLGNVTAPDFLTTSDERLKKDFVPFKNALEKVRGLRAGEYTRISTGKREYGFMAQDFERAGVPLFVDNTTSTKSLKYPRTPALLAAAIQELEAKLDRFIASQSQ